MIDEISRGLPESHTKTHYEVLGTEQQVPTLYGNSEKKDMNGTETSREGVPKCGNAWVLSVRTTDTLFLSLRNSYVDCCVRQTDGHTKNTKK